MVVQRLALPKIPDPRGNLSIIEQGHHVPFKIERIFLMYDVPGGEKRGGHAYKHSQEFIVALSGSFDVVVDDGQQPVTHSLNRSYYGLYVPSGIWRQMENFSTNSLALVLSSTHYDENDYLYDYQAYKEWLINSSKTELAPVTETKTEASVERQGAPEAKLLDLPRIAFREGNITPLEGNDVVPFDIKRVFYIYDIPGGESRGAHAHRTCHQLIVAASGSFEVILDNGTTQTTVLLNRPYQGLHVPPGIWCVGRYHRRPTRRNYRIKPR